MSTPEFAASIAYLEDLIARPIISWKEVGLQRAVALLRALGDPQERFATMQVAGTVGKGSTTTMAAAILREAGYRTGALTSPHLQSYRERIAIDGVPIDEDTWVGALSAVRPVIERMERNELPGYSLGRPAFYEVLWAMASFIFVERGVDCAVVEPGVGGRVDPTTVNAARVAVITNVSLDHTDRLGETVEAIAAEKAGLIKPGQLVISAAQGSALAVIRETCAARGATLWVVRRQDAGTATTSPLDAADVVRLEETPNATDAPFAVRTPLHRYSGLHLLLRGAHQRLNAACAVGAVDALAMQEQGISVSPPAVAAGLATASIPGRMELIEGQPPILLDGAKSPAAAAALAAALRDEYAGHRIVLVLGMLGHKDLKAMTAALAPLAQAVIVTEPPWERHAAPAAEVAAYAREHVSQVEQIVDVAEALQRARRLADADTLIVVAGSLILVGAVRTLILAGQGRAAIS